MSMKETLRRGWCALMRHQEWNIGIVNAPVSAFLDPDFVPRVHWLPGPTAGKFVADPCVFEHAGIPYILYEDFDISREIGSISACRITDEPNVEACGPMLSLQTHLAYPFVFEWQEQTYCVPESAGEDEIALYRLERIPGGLEKVCTLVPGIRGIDPTIFEFEERWWLACTDQATGSNDALKLFHAETPLGPWTSHRLDPVKHDIASARPAGRPFEVDGELYRPAQDCSKTYGGRIALNRITALSPDKFKEETVRWIEPDRSSDWPDGLHTLNGIGDISVIDGKREHFIPAAAYAAIKRNLFNRRRSQPAPGPQSEPAKPAGAGAAP